MNIPDFFKNWKRYVVSFLAFVMLLTLMPEMSFKAETIRIYPEATLTKSGTDIKINLKDDFNIAMNSEVTYKELIPDGAKGQVAFCYDVTKHSVQGERYALVDNETLEGEEGTTIRRLLTFAHQDSSVATVLGTTPREWSAKNYALAQCLVWGYQKGLSTEGIAKVIDTVLTQIDPNGWGVRSSADKNWYAMSFADKAFEYPAILGTLFVWRGSSGSQSLITWLYKPYEELLTETLDKEASYQADEVVTLHIHKTDQDTSKPLKGVSFDLYKDDVKITTVTTDVNGMATYSFKETSVKEATSSTYRYCTNYASLSVPNQELVRSHGIYISKAEAEQVALAEATTKAKAEAVKIFTEKHTYKAIETTTREKYYLNPETTVSTQSTTMASGDGVAVITFYFTNVRQMGSITITKEDAETGVHVAGAVYGLYAKEDISHPDGSTGILWKKDTLVKTFPATDDKGNASLHELYLGKYYIKEITAPNGYLLNEDTYDVELSYEGQDVSITYGSVIVSDCPVKGSIHVTKLDKELADGKDESIFDGDCNKAQGDATVEGAVYGLYTKEGTLLATAQTDEKGEFNFTDLLVGKYYIKEVSPSEGYLLDETEYEVIIEHDGLSKEIFVETSVYETVKKQAFDLLKLGQAEDSIISKPLEGVEFTVKLENDVQRLGWEKAPVYDVIVTGKDGTGSSIELPYGVYHVKETKTPSNYINGTDFFVTVEEDSREHQSFSNHIVVNKEFSAILKVVKQDAETGKTIALEGTEFKIKALTDVTVNGKEFSAGEYIGVYSYNISDPVYQSSFITDDNGMIILNKLGAGRYQLEETKAPNGYLLDTVPIEFEISSDVLYDISEDGKTPMITVIKSDYAVKGQIQIEKKGEVLTGFENGEFIYEERSLANAKFEIRNAEGDVIETLVTDENGTAISQILPLGIYEVVEVEAPDGMVLNSDSQTVELKYKDQITELVFQDVSFVNNRQTVDLDLHKWDYNTTKPLIGAEFILYAAEDIFDYQGNVIVNKDDIIAVAESDEEGNIEFNTDLPVNADFSIKETQAPEGYVLTPATFSFQTTYQGQNVKQFTISHDFHNEQIIKKTGENYAFLIPGGTMLMGLLIIGFTVNRKRQGYEKGKSI